MTDWWSFGQGLGAGLLGAALTAVTIWQTRTQNRKTDRDEGKSAVAEASMVYFFPSGSPMGTYVIEIFNHSTRNILWPELVDISRPEAEPGDSWSVNPFMRHSQSVRRHVLRRDESFEVSAILKEADDMLIERLYPAVVCTIRWQDASGQWWQRVGTHDPTRIDRPVG